MRLSHHTPQISSLLLLCALLLVHNVVATSSCNTNQNPTCQGNQALLAICCTWPNICYWSNRNGQAACCPRGTDCRLSGGPAPNVISYTPTPITVLQPTTLYVLSTTTVVVAPQTTSFVPSSSNGGSTFSTVSTNAVVILTQTAPVSTRWTTINGQFVTVTQYGGARDSRSQGKAGGLLSFLIMLAGFLNDL